MSEIPDAETLYCALHTQWSRRRIAALYAAAGWEVRKAGWSEFELCQPWAELILDADSPMLLHGAVADVLTNAEAVLDPLKAAKIAFTAECYGGDSKTPLKVWKSEGGGP